MRAYMKTVLALVISTLTLTGAVVAQDVKLAATGFPARPSGVAFVTTDLNASIEFYTKFLGYRLRSKRTIDQPAGLGTFSVPEGEVIGYANMVPGEYSEEARNFVHLNFAEIKQADASPLPADTKRGPIASETVLAFAITNLEKIDADMREAGVPVILPLAKSASGRSLAVTVLDPNGIRVQLYEFLGQ